MWHPRASLESWRQYTEWMTWCSHITTIQPTTQHGNFAYSGTKADRSISPFMGNFFRACSVALGTVPGRNDSRRGLSESACFTQSWCGSVPGRIDSTSLECGHSVTQESKTGHFYITQLQHTCSTRKCNYSLVAGIILSSTEHAVLALAQNIYSIK